jgi:hypothetical protein
LLAEASGFLVLKLLMTVWLARVLRARQTLDYLSSLVAAWTAVFALQTGVILVLSLVSLLVPAAFAIGMAISGAGLYALQRNVPRTGVEHRAILEAGVPGFLMLAPFLALWLRAAFLFDFTWDAQTYGIPRIALWLRHASVFVQMSTEQLNIFVNEWNAELNGLAYALITRSYGGASFGNAEIFGATAVGLAWVAVGSGSSLRWAFLLSAALSSSPALVGLATTVKGDLLACFGFLGMIGWYIRMYRGGETHAVFFLLSLALALGSKISVVVPAAGVLVLAFITSRRTLASTSMKNLSLIALGSVVLAARYFANWYFYGSPAVRVAAEKASFAAANLTGNAKLVLSRLFPLESVSPDGAMVFALSGGMGAAVVFALLPRVIRVGTIVFTADGYAGGVRQKVSELVAASTAWWKQPLVVSAAVSIVGSALTMTFVEAQPWGYRYFLPAILVLLIALGSCGTTTRGIGISWIGICLAVVLFNVGLSVRPGEVIPADGINALTLRLKQTETAVKRMSMLLDWPYRAAHVDLLKLDGSPKQVLVLNRLDTALLPLLGSRAQNDVQTVRSVSELLELASQPNWDAVVVSRKGKASDAGLPAELEYRGLVPIVDNDAYLIALPRRKLRLNQIVTGSMLGWEPWNVNGGSVVKVEEGQPEIASRMPVDAGFVSQPIQIEGTVLIRARFQGVVTSLDRHAAHLSLHGHQILIEIPSGSYSGEHAMYAIVPGPSKAETHRLSFGLGGWAKGAGSIRLLELDIFQAALL